MRYRLCTVITDKTGRTDFRYPQYYWRCYTSIDDALSHSQIKLTRDNATELSTGNANEYVFAHKNLFVIILDETHPSFNLNTFHLDDWEIPNSSIPEDILDKIDVGVGELILDVVESL